MMRAMRVPLMDLARQHRAIRPELDAAVREVVDTLQFIQGPAVARFEEALGAYFGVPGGGVGVASGSEALVVALMALGVGRGDEVVTTPHTFFATAAAVVRVGAHPVFADIDPETMNLDPDAVSAALTPRGKAVIPVHLFGHPAAMDRIRDTARRAGAVVVEDCAQAVGAAYKGTKVGLWGTVGCFSAYPAKNLGAFGDAGFLITTDAALARRMALIRNNGYTGSYLHGVFGYNARLDAIQAAVLDVKLRYLDGWNARRRAIAARYAEALAGLDLVLPPTPVADTTPVFHLYVVRTPARDRLAAFLAARGVEARVYYPVPLHLQACFADLGYASGAFPVAERAAREGLALPLFPEMTEAEAEHVIGGVKAFFGKS